MRHTISHPAKGASGSAMFGRRLAFALRLLGLCCLVPALSACSTVQKVQHTVSDTVIGPGGRMNMDAASSPVVYFDTKIQRAEMQVMVHPNVNLEEKPSALFVPLGVTQAMNDSLLVSQGVSHQLWQQMLQHGTFAILEPANMKPPHRVDLALPLAKHMGADMLVGGYITYYFDGGRNRDSKISIQMDVYDTATGHMLWSMVHAAVMPAHVYRDYLAFEVRSRMPEDPMGALVRAIGSDFAELLHMWTDSANYNQPERGKNYFEPAFGTF